MGNKESAYDAEKSAGQRGAAAPTHTKPWRELVLVAALCLAPNAGWAEPTVAGVVAAQKWWLTEGGPAVQRRLPGGAGMNAWRPSVPFYLQNNSDRTIQVSIESPTCDPFSFSIEVGESISVHCDSGEGDDCFNIRFLGEGYSIGEPTYAVLENSGGKIDFFIYTSKLQK
jgi:hypothetical protein